MEHRHREGKQNTEMHNPKSSPAIPAVYHAFTRHKQTLLASVWLLVIFTKRKKSRSEFLTQH